MQEGALQDWGMWVAIYAAFVATGTLFLEVRRWVEGRPRLHLSVMQHAQLVNVPGIDPDNTYLSVSVSNRGALPTTLTHFAFIEFPNPWVYLCRLPGFWACVRRKHKRLAVVVDPSLRGAVGERLPYELSPGGRWSGFALQDEKLDAWIAEDRLYLGILANHSDRPTLVRLRPDRAVLKDAERL